MVTPNGELTFDISVETSYDNNKQIPGYPFFKLSEYPDIKKHYSIPGPVIEIPINWLSSLKWHNFPLTTVHVYARHTWHRHTVPDITKLASIDCSEWSTLYFKCTTQYYTLVPYAITYKCNENSHITTCMIIVQNSTIVLLRSTIKYHLIKV